MDLFAFYNSINGDIDERAYNSDLLVQRFWQRNKTENIAKELAVEKGDVFIDIGCGSGVQSKVIAYYSGCKLSVGIDVSVNAVRHARKYALDNTEFVVADARYLPIKSGCADKVLCAEILEHIDGPDLLLEEIRRIVTDDGAVVITTPNDTWLWRFYELLWDTFGRGREYGKTHLQFFNETKVQDIFWWCMVCRTSTYFFLSPALAVLGNERLLEWGKRFDRFFEKHGWGTSLLVYARKGK